MKKKNLRKKLSIKESFRILSFILGAVLVSACAEDLVFPVSEVVPEAEALVRVHVNERYQYEVELEVENLPGPDKLDPPQQYYVVWMVTRRDGTIPIGTLQINGKNEASIEEEIPYEPIRLFITAEGNQDVVIPSERKILDSGEFEV